MRRHAVLAGRVLLWTVVALVFVRGAVSLVGPSREPAAVAVAQSPDAGFPVDEGRAFAARLAHDYLTYDAANPELRRKRLAEYLPDGADALAGWDGTGTQVAVNAVPVTVDVRGAGRAVVTVAVEVTGPRWLHLGVPLASDGQGVVLAGTPVLVPAPPLAEVPPRAQLATDAPLTSELRPVVEAFFRSYAGDSESELAYYLPASTSMPVLGGSVSLDALTELAVAEGEDEREATAAVRWRDRTTGAGVVQSYHLSLVQRDGRWYVSRLGADPGRDPREKGQS